MKHIGFIIAAIFLFIGIVSCEDQYLEKPIGDDLVVDSIFASKQRAMSAIAQVYQGSLASGLPVLNWDNNRRYGMTSGTISHLSGEVNALKFNWEDAWRIQRSGMTADDGSGRPRSDDGFNFNYIAIRRCFLVIDNIHKVPDMSDKEKDEVRAEMKTLIAYRYQEMFKRYGGVPIVKGTLTVEDEILIPRASLEDLLKHIITLCDEAIAVLPDSYADRDKGRVTKGVAMAIKAEVLMYAARPLFNSPTPYLNLDGHNNLISFGRTDRTLWERAVQASLDVLDWAENNNHYIINTGSPFDDYGTAVATPGNVEVLLAYKNQRSGGNTQGTSQWFDPREEAGGANAMSFNMLTQYYKADGTDQVWPTSSTPYIDYQSRIEEMEPRYKVSAMGAGIDAWNNPGSTYWTSRVITDGSTNEGRAGTEACGRRVKFWYMAGNRKWFEYPIYRLAEFYLNLAEAYNELDNPQKSLEYLNEIRDRAGLNDITETNKDNLRRIIQREWAVEFYEEGHRFFAVKHWKHPDLGNGIIGGSKKSLVYTYQNANFGYVAADYVSYSVETVYEGFWNVSQYLTPFPIAEVNKGYLIQNPGY